MWRNLHRDFHVDRVWVCPVFPVPSASLAHSRYSMYVCAKCPQARRNEWRFLVGAARVMCILEKRDLWFRTIGRGSSELWDSGFETNKGQAAYFFVPIVKKEFARRTNGWDSEGTFNFSKGNKPLSSLDQTVNASV